ncbi:MAG: glutathione S-transferase family protein [Nannocystaceae bacterium]
MGKLIDGIWHDVWYDTRRTEGHFVRAQSGFRSWVTVDGSAGPGGGSGFRAESGRYHLYVSYACPWAHRTLIFRKLKGLEDIVGLSVVHYSMGQNGWTFQEGPQTIPDTVSGSEFLHQVYTRAESSYSGRVTVPVLWDKQTNTIVSNESSEIIRMFNSAFDRVEAVGEDYWPEQIRTELEVVNERIYDTLNNGVYRCGFATTQPAYDESVARLFETLDWLENRLSTRRYLMGCRLTEGDWRLFTTLVRFDVVYVGHFKTNLKRIVDYPSIWAYTRDLYQVAGVRETVNFEHIKKHYFQSHTTINPTGIVPAGPVLDFDAPHGRERVGET